MSGQRWERRAQTAAGPGEGKGSLSHPAWALSRSGSTWRRPDSNLASGSRTKENTRSRRASADRRHAVVSREQPRSPVAQQVRGAVSPPPPNRSVQPTPLTTPPWHHNRLSPTVRRMVELPALTLSRYTKPAFSTRRTSTLCIRSRRCIRAAAAAGVENTAHGCSCCVRFMHRRLNAPYSREGGAETPLNRRPECRSKRE